MYCGRNLLGEGEQTNKWQWRGEEANQARSNVLMLQVLDVSEALPDLVWNGYVNGGWRGEEANQAEVIC